MYAYVRVRSKGSSAFRQCPTLGKHKKMQLFISLSLYKLINIYIYVVPIRVWFLPTVPTPAAQHCRRSRIVLLRHRRCIHTKMAISAKSGCQLGARTG